MPKYSVIVPVYNVAEYLEECVQSVLIQSCSDFELILIDDGSTDKSGILCDEFAVKDCRITVIHQENRGLSAARNAGIKIAAGAYIVFLDSDDFWDNADVLAAIDSRICKTDAQVLSFNYTKFCQGKKSAPYFKNACSMPAEVESTFRYQIENNLWIACAWNKVMERALFENYDLRFVEGITAEDIDWSLRLALCAERFDFLSEELVCYRIRENSISKSVTIPKLKTLLDNIDTCTSLLERCEDPEKAELLLSYISFQYGTVLFRLAVLDRDDMWTELFARAKKQQYLLKYSNSKKIRLLYAATQIGGFRFALFLLRLLYCH